MLWGRNTQYNHSVVRHFRCWRKLKYCGRKIKGPLCWEINVSLSSVLVEKNKVHNKQHKQWGNIYHTGLLARPQRMSRPAEPRRGSTCCHINVFKRSPVVKFQEVGMPLVEWVTTAPPRIWKERNCKSILLPTSKMDAQTRHVVQQSSSLKTWQEQWLVCGTAHQPHTGQKWHRTSISALNRYVMVRYGRNIALQGGPSQPSLWQWLEN